MNRGGVGARSLNIELQTALNPAGERKVERFGWTFAPGDKVMQIENDYDKEVYNGDIGQIDNVDMTGETHRHLRRPPGHLRFGNSTAVPAYTATHKSQGSEYPAVVMPIMTQHYTMLQRNLLYTASPGAKAGRAGRSEEGRRHRGTQRFGPKVVVEIERVAGIQITVDAEKMRADYECTQSA